MMDKHDLKACGMVKNVINFHSPEQPDLLGKAKGLTGCSGVFSDRNTGPEKLRHGSVSDHETNSCESAKSPETERKCLNQDCISSIECAKEDADDSRPLSSVASSSRNSELVKETCTEGTSSEVPHCNGSLKDSDIAAESPRGIDSAQNISIKSDVSSQGRQALSKESNELTCGRMNEYWLDAGEDRLKFPMQATDHNKQPKTESCSSNSTRVIFPASSNDSCQETSVDGKSCEHNKRSGTDVPTYTNFKCNMEEPAVKSLVLGMAAQIAPRDGMYVSGFLREKKNHVCDPSEIVESVRTRDCHKLQGGIAHNNAVTVGASHIPKSNLPKKENPELPKKKPWYEANDALDVSRRAAREMEREVGMYKEASGSCSSVQERSGETVHLSSVDSAATNKDCLTESGSKILFGNEQDKCDSICSIKDEVDPQMPTTSKDLHLEVKEPSQEMGTVKKHEAKDGLRGQGSSPLIRKPEDVSANDQPTCVSRIDLNENILVNEVDFPKQSTKETGSWHSEIVSKPIPVVAKSGISVCLPKLHLQLAGEASGWRGSAATSAFRSTSLPESFSSIKASSAMDGNTSSKSSQINGIDLNVAAEGDDCDMELLPEKCAQAMSSFPSKVFSAGISSTLAERFKIDLNCVGENDDNCRQLSPPASLSRHSVRNFDLNDNPIPADACSDDHLPGQGKIALRDRVIDNNVVNCLANARQPGSSGVGSSYWADLNAMQSFRHDHAKPFLMSAVNMHPRFEQMQSVVSLQQGSSYPAFPPVPPPRPHHALPYNNAFFIDPNNQLSSAIFPLGVIPCITDPTSTAVFPHMLGSSALPAFSGAPLLMQAPGGAGPSDIAIIRPSFNLNGGATSSDNGSWGENGRQRFIPVSNSTTEDQMRSFQQLALSATPMKRKEPEGGLDSDKLGFRKMTSWR